MVNEIKNKSISHSSIEIQTFSLKKKIGRAFEHSFSIITNLSSMFSDLLKRIKSKVSESFNKPQEIKKKSSQKTVNQINKLTNKNISIKKVASSVKNISEPKLIINNNKFKLEPNNLETLLTSQASKKFEDLFERVSSDLNVPNTTTANRTESKSNANVKNLNIEQNLNVSETSIQTKLINVPDNGNCLFYALTLGIGKKFLNVKNELEWDVNVDELNGDFFHKEHMLNKPADKLRQEAAKFLIDSVKQYESTLKSTAEELNMSEAELIEMLNYQDDFKIDKDGIYTALQTSIQSHNLVRGHEGMIKDIADYINHSKKDHFYGGVAEILALSKKYDISIRVIYNYNADDQREEIFNKKTDESTIITIACTGINQNHFQYLDD